MSPLLLLAPSITEITTYQETLQVWRVCGVMTRTADFGAGEPSSSLAVSSTSCDSGEIT